MPTTTPLTRIFAFVSNGTHRRLHLFDGHGPFEHLTPGLSYEFFDTEGHRLTVDFDRHWSPTGLSRNGGRNSRKSVLARINSTVIALAKRYPDEVELRDLRFDDLDRAYEKLAEIGFAHSEQETQSRHQHENGTLHNIIVHGWPF